VIAAEAQGAAELFWACLALVAVVFVGIPEIWKRRRK
jgi:hypothetical protein